MPKLIVTPIDPAAPGSFAERRKLLQMAQRLQGTDTSNTAEVLTAYNAMEQYVLSRAKTEDGTPVEDVLATISADDFDALLGAIYGKPETVPPPNSDS